MHKRLRAIFFVALITGGGIIAFQCYWLFNAYHVARNNFYKSAGTALQQSIDLLQLYNLKEKQFNPKDSHVSLFLTPKPPDSSKIKASGETKANIRLSPKNMQLVRLMIAKVSAQAANELIDLNKLSPIFKRELATREIQLPFKLLVSKNFPSGDDVVAGYSGLGSASDVIVAQFSFGIPHLFSLLLIPVIVSLVLVMLTAGCLFYMWKIIYQQARLDTIKNDFINNMTHELKTPVAILQSTHEALDTFCAVTNTDKTLKYLRANRTVLNKLERNIDRILDITRYSQGKDLARYEQIDLNEKINEIIRPFWINERAEVRYEAPLTDPLVNTDPYFIEVILSNLIDNAVKYADHFPLVTVAAEKTGYGWNIQVKDNGKGIAREDMPFIFDKFYRVPTNDIHDIKGFGLGLSYVKDLTGLLGGTVTVKSELNEGTRFTIKFPGHE